MSALSFVGMKRPPIIRQSEAAECGLACLAMIAAFYGHDIGLNGLRRRFSLSMRGTSLRTLIEISAELQMVARPLKCEPSELNRLQLPAILHWGMNHYVVLTRVSKRKIYIHDPALGAIALPMRQVHTKFTGVALELQPGPRFVPVRHRDRIRLSNLVSLRGGAFKPLLISFSLSLVLEVLLLASPFYLQLSIDRGVIQGDKSLLAAIALGFGFALIIRAATSVMRDLSSQFVAQTLSYEMQGRVFSHLIRLPLAWFQKRTVGDIQNRFNSVHSLQGFLSSGLITGLIDSMLSFGLLLVMILYSPRLTFIVAVGSLLFLITRLSLIHAQRLAAGDLIVAQSKEQTGFLETVRAAETIKGSLSEEIRDASQRSLFARSINAFIKQGNLLNSYSGVVMLINGLTDILLIYNASLLAIEGAISLGMLTAYLAYHQQFVARFSNTIEQFVSWRLIGLQLDRLADIVLSPQEKSAALGGHVSAVQGAISCRNVGFQYGYGERPILSNVSFSVQPGEFVAITGPSGCGKTTLLKIIGGFYEASLGDVIIDSRPISTWNTRSLRSQISIVSQHDQMLAGTIAENIASFDDHIDMDHVIRCSSISALHDEILEMPMGYESLVGDMGSALSGGQRQRLSIARALYRNPRILLLDEGTSHLDIHNEMAINQSLAKLAITRIVVAHRPETIRAANRVLTLLQGRVVSDSLAEDHDQSSLNNH